MPDSIVHLPASLEAEAREFLTRRCQEATFSVRTTSRFSECTHVHLNGAGYMLVGDVCGCRDLRLFVNGGWAYPVCTEHGLQVPMLIDRVYASSLVKRGRTEVGVRHV